MTHLLKTVVLTLSFGLLLSLSGCCGDCDGSNTYDFYNFHDVYYADENNTIILEYRHNFSDNDQNSQISLSTDKDNWEKVSDVHSPLSNEVVKFENGTTNVYDDNGSVLFTLTPPTILEIQESTSIALPNAMAVYNVLKDGRDYRWDRATYVVNIGIEKLKRDDDSTEYTFSAIYCFSLVYDGVGSWNITYIDRLPDRTDGTYFYEGDLDIASNSIGEILGIKRVFLDGALSLCHRWNIIDDERCFQKDDSGNVTLRKLYGDILPTGFRETLNTLYDSKAFRTPSPSVYFFDIDHNMHLFYNDTEKAEGKYFNYIMYTKEEPRVPKHEQKIEWK